MANWRSDGWHMGIKCGVGDGVDPRNTPEWYLQLVKKCSLKVQDIISSEGSNTSPKFNYEQCKYLADRLASALTGVDTFQRVFRVKCGDADVTEHLDIFKFFLSLAFEVETFVQGCCTDAWIQAAFTLANVVEHVILLGFNLELYRIAFLSNIDEWRATHKQTADEVAQISEVVVEAVKKGAARDMETLLKKLEDAKMSPVGKFRREDVELATFLLERLNRGISIAQGSSIGESWLKDPTGLQRSESSRSDFGRSSDIFSDLEQKRSLGKGSSGEVREATFFGSQVAVKTFSGLDDDDFTKEVSFLERWSHSNVMSLFCDGKNHRKCTSSIVMELMDGDLCALLEERLKGDGSDESPPCTIFEAVDLMFQIASGMQYIYENRVVHRDLKSGNVFFRRVKEPESSIEYVHVKVGDFGLSKTKERSRTYSKQEPNTGTTRWMAPELMPENGFGFLEWIRSFLGIQAQHFPFKSDVYSFAMVCYEILSGYRPFQTISNKDVRKQVLAGRRPPLLSGQCPDELKPFIEICWDGIPSKRPSFVEICAELKYLKYHFLTRFVQDIQKIKELDPDHASDEEAQDVPEPKHKIFLSHSGVQKDFVEHLVHGLEMKHRYPFFDRRPSSLPIGKSFPALIFNAISQSCLGVVVLSEEYFTRSKWPMIELHAILRSRKQNPNYRILPVYFGISPSELGDPENHKRWRSVWAEWAKVDSRIILNEWIDALFELRRTNALVFRVDDSIISFQKEVVHAICMFVPPEMDDSHTNSRTGDADAHNDWE